eukprot:TRINITY_DN74097_c0_g1_i1.p1 TRINITY_DN74097_c0_g1~~TRINITY_DN74097_c0_g1_i1.p1  ORF type:complete len:581 (+),score=204.10 TRINITY_DN74097_c0_g1_i1:52-1743(+)
MSCRRVACLVGFVAFSGDLLAAGKRFGDDDEHEDKATVKTKGEEAVSKESAAVAGKKQEEKRSQRSGDHAATKAADQQAKKQKSAAHSHAKKHGHETKPTEKKPAALVETHQKVEASSPVSKSLKKEDAAKEASAEHSGEDVVERMSGLDVLADDTPAQQVGMMGAFDDLEDSPRRPHDAAPDGGPAALFEMMAHEMDAAMDKPRRSASHHRARPHKSLLEAMLEDSMPGAMQGPGSAPGGLLQMEGPDGQQIFTGSAPGGLLQMEGPDGQPIIMQMEDRGPPMNLFETSMQDGRGMPMNPFEAALQDGSRHHAGRPRDPLAAALQEALGGGGDGPGLAAPGMLMQMGGRQEMEPVIEIADGDGAMRQGSVEEVEQLLQPMLHEQQQVQQLAQQPQELSGMLQLEGNDRMINFADAVQQAQAAAKVFESTEQPAASAEPAKAGGDTAAPASTTAASASSTPAAAAETTAAGAAGEAAAAATKEPAAQAKAAEASSTAAPETTAAAAAAGTPAAAEAAAAASTAKPAEKAAVTGAKSAGEVSARLSLVVLTSAVALALSRPLLG